MPTGSSRQGNGILPASGRGLDVADDDHDQQQLLRQPHTRSDAVADGLKATAATAGRSSQHGAALDRLLPKARGFSPISQQEGLQQQQQGHGLESGAGRWCPEDEAGWVSRLLFSFVSSLMAKGQHLEQQDLWDTSRQDEPQKLWGQFQQQLAATATPAAPEGVLWRAMWRVMAHNFMVTAVVKVVHDLLMFLQPYILELLLHHLSGARDRWIALGLAGLMLVASLLEALTVNVYFNILFRMSLHTKVQLLELLYRKALRVSSAVKSAMGVGPIMNLQSNDAAKLWSLPSYIHMIWNGPFQIIIVMSMLVRVLTLWPALAGLGMTVAIIPLTMMLGRMMTAARKESVAAADARVKLTTEVITGIKAIKLMAWEEPYLKRITELRDAELAAIKKSQLLSMINSSVFNTAPVLVSLAAFGTYAALGHPLTAAVAFPSLALFNLLRFPIVMIPQQIFNLIAARVGITRIQEFLDSAEMTGVHRLPTSSNANTTSSSGAAAGSNDVQKQQQAAVSPYADLLAGSVDNISSSDGVAQGSTTRSVEMTATSLGSRHGTPQQQQPLELSTNKHGRANAPVSNGTNGTIASNSKPPAAAAAAAAVSIQGCSFAWSPGEPPVLHDLQLQVPSGALVMVVGPVGSGKSSLLAAVLGEMVATAAAGAGGGSCQVSVAGSVAYTAQDPWIQNATLRNNILMGLPYDEGRYANTLKVCCLEKDLQMLPAGDASEIGEKGINLSGGQKHRVALARAVYASAAVLLLDDPLSAVDAHVGRSLFDGCICGQLRGRTRLLVTHQLQYLPRADMVLVLLDGRIAHMGTYQQLMSSGVDLSAFVPPQHDEEEEREGADSQQAEGLSCIDASDTQPQQQQQQQQPLERSLLAADSQQLGDREGVKFANVSLPSMFEQQQRQQELRSADSAVQLVQLPSFYTKSLLATGGSFASHVPVKLDTQAQQGGGQSAGGVYSSEVVDGAAADAATTAAAAAAASAGGSLVPSAGEAVNLAVDAIQPELYTPSLQQQQQQQQAGSNVADESSTLISSAAGAAAGKSDDPQQWQDPDISNTDKDASGSGNAAGGGSSSVKRVKGQLVLAEQRAKGQVKRSVYLAYLTAMGPLLAVPIAVLIGAFGERGLQVLQNLVLSVWSNHTSSVQKQRAAAAAADAPSPSYNTAFYLTLYFALGLGSVGVVLLRSALLVVGSISASRRLHKQLLHKLLRLPMSFFDAQPSGRLINRFTKDTEAVDTQLSAAVNSALSCLVSAVLAIIVVVSVSPFTVLVLVPLAALYYKVQGLYLNTSRELKRLDALAFSPIFQHYAETLNGLPTIRAFQRQHLFEDINRGHIIQSNRAWWPIQLLNRWLSMRLELTGAVVVFAAAVAVGVISPRNAGLAGLALTSALNLTGNLAWLVRQVTELEVNMNAVERMVEWKDSREEAPAVLEPRPPPAWPHAGSIQAVQLVVRYRPDLPPVIKGLSFNVKAGEKIGICGRTGCGKSTLMLALFRIIEPSGGAIVIDGLDTATMGLTDLRSRLSLVPQDPVVFSGSFRSNLDPFGQAGSDAAVWEALRQAGLDGMVRSMGGLDAPIQEGGGNLSGGQRQLLCMARALLRSSRILVLDEATSNVDQAADALLQGTLRRAFAYCTVLTIAHRLNTISDADRVMVLDAGELREFDSPTVLMTHEGGVFRGLMKEATRSHGPHH